MSPLTLLRPSSRHQALELTHRLHEVMEQATTFGYTIGSHGHNCFELLRGGQRRFAVIGESDGRVCVEARGHMSLDQARSFTQNLYREQDGKPDWLSARRQV